MPDGSTSIESAWVDALRQDEGNRSNLALVNTGEMDGSESVFRLDIYDGDSGRLAGTVITRPLPAGRWHQVNSILANHARGGGLFLAWQEGAVPAAFAGPAAVVDHAVGDEGVVARGLPHLQVSLADTA